MFSVRTKIHESGRILIPAHFRRALNIMPDDDFVLHIKDNELVLTPLKFAIKKAQDKVKTYNVNNISLTDTLHTLRQQERS